MKKLAHLRQHLLNSVSGLSDDPGRLRTYIPEGNIRYSPGPNLSHEYRFTAEVIVVNHSDSMDTIIIPLLQWFGRYQPDADPDTAVRFSAEIHRDDDVDIIIALDLTERVVARVDSSTGIINAEHRMPDYSLDTSGPTNWQLLTKAPGDDDYSPVSTWPES